TEAITFARAALGRHPEDTRLVNVLANAELDGGHPYEAAATADQALESAPDSLELHDVRARAAEMVGDRASQLEHERRLFEMAPKESTTEIRYATTLIKAGERRRGQALLIDVLLRARFEELAAEVA